MGAPYEPYRVANFFLQKSPVTQMQLQKLIYFAHGWHLALTGEPLIDEAIEAWKYGPVVPSLHSEFTRFGARPITDLAYSDIPWLGRNRSVPKRDLDAREVLNSVWVEYGTHSAWELSAMTHRSGSPWSDAHRRNPDVRRPVIADSLMEKYFRTLGGIDAGQDLS